MGVTLAPGISHRPGSSSENIIQPVVDATGLILRPFSNAQPSPVFQVQNVDGTDVHFGLNPDGEIELSGGIGTAGQVLTSGGAGNPVAWATPSGGDLSSAVILAPDSVNRNLIQPTADANKGLAVYDHSPSQSAVVVEVGAELSTAFGSPKLAVVNEGTGAGVIFKRTAASPTLYDFVVLNENDSPLFWVSDGTFDTTAGCLNPTNNDGFTLGVGSPAGGNTSAAIRIFSTVGAGPADYHFFQIKAPFCDLVWNLEDNGTLHPETARVRAEWADDTVGATKGRLLLTTHDSGGEREGLRIEGTGAAAAIGFLGAGAAARQTLPAAATDPATTQALANALRSLAITFGLAN